MITEGRYPTWVFLGVFREAGLRENLSFFSYFHGTPPGGLENLLETGVALQSAPPTRIASPDVNAVFKGNVASPAQQE